MSGIYGLTTTLTSPGLRVFPFGLLVGYVSGMSTGSTWEVR